jgi:site-specific recombinase XerD
MSVTFIRIGELNPQPYDGAVMQVREIRVTADVWRRHCSDCKMLTLGRNAIRCDCPLWGDGYIEGQRVLRMSLDTRSLEIAIQRLNSLIADYIREKYPHPFPEPAGHAPVMAIPAPLGVSAVKPAITPAQVNPDDPRLIRNVTNAFLTHCETNGNKASTMRKVRNACKQLTAYSERPTVGKPLLEDWEVVDLDAFRRSRGLAKVSSAKELEILRQLWNFGTVRGWCKQNIAKLIKAPQITEQNDVVPYTKREQAAILAACDTFGRNDYERRRAKGMIQTLRHTALRISDVALLEKSRITRDKDDVARIFLHTTKNNARVYLPVHPDMLEALEALPTPRGADKSCRYFFWNGRSKPKSMITVAEETLKAVFAKAGVEKGGAHRYRHTLASTLLEAGATFEEVADILGNSVQIVKKHYEVWGRGRQKNIDRLMRKVRGGRRCKS